MSDSIPKRTSGPIFTGDNSKYSHWCVDVISPEDREYDLTTLTGLQAYFKTTDPDFQKLKAAFIVSKLWAPGSQIHIGFLASTPNESSLPDSWAWKRAWVCKVVSDTVANVCNLNFIYHMNPSEGPSCHIRVTFDPEGGCYSRLGIDSLQNWGGLNETMNFGWMDAPFNHNFTFNGVSYTTPSSFDQGGYPGYGTTIIHELGHALGMIHEHQTPFNNPIQWNRDLIYSIFEGPPNNWSRADIDYNIINRYSASGMNGSSFDPYSIMKYTFPSYLLLNPSQDLITAIQRTNLTLSNCDSYWLAYNYPGKLNQTTMSQLQSQCSADSNISSPTTAPPTPAPTTPGSTPIPTTPVSTSTPAPTTPVPTPYPTSGPLPTTPGSTPTPTLTPTPAPTISPITKRNAILFYIVVLVAIYFLYLFVKDLLR